MLDSEGQIVGAPPKFKMLIVDNDIDDFGYDDEMHFALLSTKEGVSLERINFDRPSIDKSNWHSASELAGFATPAYENSQFMDVEDIESVINTDKTKIMMRFI